MSVQVTSFTDFQDCLIAKIGEILGLMLQDVLETPEHNRKELLLARHVPKKP